MCVCVCACVSLADMHGSGEQVSQQHSQNHLNAVQPERRLQGEQIKPKTRHVLKVCLLTNMFFLYIYIFYFLYLSSVIPKALVRINSLSFSVLSGLFVIFVFRNCCNHCQRPIKQYINC